jgi:translation initiation factor IF-3
MILNNDIKGFRFRLAHPDGTSEILSRDTIWDRAETEQLDVVLVSSKSIPATVKLLDYGKYNYDLSKKDQENSKRRRETKVVVKTVQLSSRIEEHDIATKRNTSNKFLEAGDTVEVVLKLKGRENSHKSIAINVIENFVNGLSNKKANHTLKQTNNLLVITIESSIKKGQHDNLRKDS